LQYWKNVPLNKEVVLRLDNRGSNFILAEVLFSNGVSALYGGDLNVDASETKSNAEYWFKKDRPEDRKLIIKESKLPKDFESSPDRVIWQAAQQSFCNALSQNGFHICDA
jgi:hypothetical protein